MFELQLFMLLFLTLQQSTKPEQFTSGFNHWLSVFTWTRLHFLKTNYENKLMCFSKKKVFYLFDDEYLQMPHTLGEGALRARVKTRPAVCARGRRGMESAYYKFWQLQNANFSSTYCPKVCFPRHSLLQKHEGKWVKWRVKAKTETNNGLCCSAGETACQVGFAERGIFPDQSSLTDSLPQEKKKDRVWKLRTKEIPADKVKTN